MFKPSRILVLALTIVLCSGAAHARQFQSSDVEAPDHPAVRSVAFMGELMRQRTSGRLWISDVGASDHNTEIFTVAQLRTGTLDMARISVTALHGSVPVTVVPTPRTWVAPSTTKLKFPATPTAATDVVPSRPTQYRSIRKYSVWKTIITSMKLVVLSRWPVSEPLVRSCKWRVGCEGPVGRISEAYAATAMGANPILVEETTCSLPCAYEATLGLSALPW